PEHVDSHGLCELRQAYGQSFGLKIFGRPFCKRNRGLAGRSNLFALGTEVEAENGLDAFLDCRQVRSKSVGGVGLFIRLLERVERRALELVELPRLRIVRILGPA